MVCYGLHHLPDVDRPHLLQLARGDEGQDVVVIGIAVCVLGVIPQAALVGGKPRLGPLVHRGGVPHHKALPVLVSELVGGLVYLGDGAAIDKPLSAVGEGDFLLIASVLSFFHKIKTVLSARENTFPLAFQGGMGYNIVVEAICALPGLIACRSWCRLGASQVVSTGGGFFILLYCKVVF